MMQVTKVWWDGEKLMAEPIDPTTIHQEPAQQDSTCSNALRAQGKSYPRTCKKCGFGPCVELARQQNPAVLKWQQAPLQTAWGDEMMVASVAIDNDHTLSLYCERDQAPKVEAMFAQRTWVGLTPEELDEMFSKTLKGKKLVNWVARAIEAKLKEKNT